MDTSSQLCSTHDLRSPGVKKRVLIITGATSGIGYETALLFIRKGWVVYACGRNRDKLETLRAKGAEVRAFDLADQSAAEGFMEEILKKEKGVDLLVNNAGYGLYGSVEEVSPRAARHQFEINLFAAARLIQLVLPLMRKQRQGRIINISSMAGVISFPMGGWYHASKFAMEGFSDCLRQEVAPFGIRVILVEPGAVRTQWPEAALREMEERSGQGPYDKTARDMGLLFRKFYKTGTTSEKVAALIWKAAVSRCPRRRYASPAHSAVFMGFRRLMGAWLWDRSVALALRLAGEKKVKGKS